MIVSSIAVCGIFFFAGMEYKSYQIRSTLQNAFNPVVTEKPVSEELKETKTPPIIKNIGDELTLATIKLKVNKLEEKQILSPQYGSPKIAKEGAKFVIMNFDVINITEKEFSLPAEFLLVDNKNREFKPINSIGSIENYMDYRNLTPSLKETGNFVYEVPVDSINYDLILAKGGTNEIYQIKLK
jgi:hypothetical protein